VRPEFAIKEAFYNLRETTKTPQLTAIRFDEVDEAGHRWGTVSDKTNEIIITVDNYVGEILDSLKSLNIYDKTDIIFLSVHGITDVNNYQTVNIGEILYNKNVEIINSGSFAFLYCNQDSVETIVNLLNKNLGLHAYKKEDIPENLHIKHHPYAPDILVLADDDKIITEKNDFGTYNLKAIHGYPPENKSMNGIFIAAGPSFKQNPKTEEIRIIDIFPLICTLFKKHIPNCLDGDIKKIQEILK
jgi:ectonucleotide pyrophosphatase/phosphodiesterase family protein 5